MLHLAGPTSSSSQGLQRREPTRATNGIIMIVILVADLWGNYVFGNPSASMISNPIDSRIGNPKT